MILSPKKTTIAYRCDKCGSAVLAEIDMFSLNAALPRLSCSCKESELKINVGQDSKVRITAPCMFCPNPHQFTLSSATFFEKELFALACPYTGVTLVAMGKEENVKDEMLRSTDELMAIAAQSREEIAEMGITQEELFGFDEEETEEDTFDREMYEDLFDNYVNKLASDGNVTCRCGPGNGYYEVELLNGGINIRCPLCGASFTKMFETEEEFEAWLKAKRIELE